MTMSISDSLPSAELWYGISEASCVVHAYGDTVHVSTCCKSVSAHMCTGTETKSDQVGLGRFVNTCKFAFELILHHHHFGESIRLSARATLLNKIAGPQHTEQLPVQSALSHNSLQCLHTGSWHNVAIERKSSAFSLEISQSYSPAGATAPSMHI